nr:MAG TPA: hypothetical protein [Caudoviricetes sp.]
MSSSHIFSLTTIILCEAIMSIIFVFENLLKFILSYPVLNNVKTTDDDHCQGKCESCDEADWTEDHHSNDPDEK